MLPAYNVDKGLEQQKPGFWQQVMGFCSTQQDLYRGM